MALISALREDKIVARYVEGGGKRQMKEEKKIRRNAKCEDGQRRKSFEGN